MRFWVEVRSFVDLIIETVAIKSGILLCDYDVSDIITGTEMEEWKEVIERPYDHKIGVRPEFFADIINVIRFSIGNIPDAKPGSLIAVERFRKFYDQGKDISNVNDIVFKVLSSGLDLDEEDINKLRESNLSEDDFEEILDIFNTWRDREYDFLVNRDSREWDGITSLSKLFKEELIPDDEQMFLDQKFIDYLSANSDKMMEIHWRNFERLIAEFFRRLGLVVKLGPGKKDGGVDIRVWSEKAEAEKTPLLLIQCKRYKNLVGVEYVKALWTDVEFEGARYGIVATTSRVSKEGKKLCEARKYNVSFAEREKVIKWSRTMWRNPWRGGNLEYGVGKYLLPPVYP